MKIFLAFLLVLLNFQVSAQQSISEYLLNNSPGNKNTWVIIVANEDYQSYSDAYTENCDLAIYQAERFQQMLIKQAGLPAGNILFYTDATNTHIKLAIAKFQKSLNNDSRVIFYYRGKIFQNPLNKELFLVPVDATGNETFFMFGLSDLQRRLGELKIASSDIFIDAFPDHISGRECILDNGFVKLPVSGSNKKQSTFTVQPTEKKPEPDVTDAPILAVKPIITIKTPIISESETYESSVLISGEIESACSLAVVAVNGEEASFTNEGAFSARVVLSKGENTIAVEAKNCTGWSREYISINKLSPPIDSVLTDESSTVKPTGSNYALLIGVSQYRDAMMPNLFYPVKDALKIKDVLVSQYDFNPDKVILLQNPGKNVIIETLDSLNTILKPEDSFLMFYAGHGSWDDKSRMGYWLPSDAAALALDNWIMNSIITGFIGKIPVKHSLVIADACFSGSIFRTRAFLPEEEKKIADLYAKSSRKAMTSGDMTEVPDESVFMKYFVQKLEENKEEYISSEQLFFEVKPQVVSAIDLIPQFGIIKNSGDEGGDYIFFRK